MRINCERIAFQFWIGLGQAVISLVDRLRLPLKFRDIQPYETIRSGTRTLCARFVCPSDPPVAAVLLLHGIGDRIEYWADAQNYLRQQGVASLIFHYSGHAGSTGSLTPDNLFEDVHVAYASLRQQMHVDAPTFVLGFSLGSGLATHVIPTLSPPPAGLILAQPFTSLQWAAGEVAKPLRFLRYLVPDIWQTASTIHLRQQPLLIVHSDGDRLFPLQMARTIYTAAQVGHQPPAYLVVPGGYPHNAIYLQVPQSYWRPILEFIEAHSSPRLD